MPRRPELPCTCEYDFEGAMGVHDDGCPYGKWVEEMRRRKRVPAAKEPKKKPKKARKPPVKNRFERELDI